MRADGELVAAVGHQARDEEARLVAAQTARGHVHRANEVGPSPI